MYTQLHPHFHKCKKICEVYGVDNPLSFSIKSFHTVNFTEIFFYFYEVDKFQFVFYFESPNIQDQLPFYLEDSRRHYWFNKCFNNTTLCQAQKVVKQIIPEDFRMLEDRVWWFK